MTTPGPVIASVMVTPSAPGNAARRRQTLRLCSMLLMLGLFHGLPWLQWNGVPLLLFDVGARQIHFFGLLLRPEGLLPLLWLALSAAAALCLMTNIGGRLWCGHACPQTVLTRLHRGLHRLFAFNGAPRWLAPFARHAAWALVALWTGISFVGYFVPIRTLVGGLHPFTLSGWETFWIGFYALATWANVLYLHEQVCTYLCPYSRVQPLLADASTPTLHYDARRGEPRGPRAPGNGSVLERARGLLDPMTARDYVFRAAHPASAGTRATFKDAHLGDCTDCGDCVRACPIGLDIRNGATTSCIECSACIDACDTTMQRNDFPTGLIRRARIPPLPHTRLRAKPLLFAALSLLFLTLAVAGLATA